MSENFNLYSKYYDLLYTDKDYQSESEYIISLLRKYGNNPVSLLELGMGTGNHAEIIRRNSFEIAGVEISEEMAKIASAKGLECYEGSCTSFNLNKKFDAVISLFHVISYVVANGDLVSTFINVHNHLTGGGIFVFDVWYSPAVYNLQPQTRVKRLSDDEMVINRLAEPVKKPNSNVIDVNYEIIIEDISTGKLSRIHEVHPMRHFSIPEMEILALHTGFEVIAAEEWLNGNAPGENSWGVCFVLKKK